MGGTGDRRGDDRGAALEREPAGAVMGRAERVGIRDARSFRKHHHQPARGEDRPGRLERLSISLTAADGERPEAVQQPGQRSPEQLHLGL